MPSDVEHARCANCIRSVTRDLLASISIIRRGVIIREEIDFRRDKLFIATAHNKIAGKPTAETWPRLKPAEHFYGVNLVGRSAKKVPVIKSAY